MNPARRQFLQLAAGAALLPACAGAQAYPSRPVKIIVGQALWTKELESYKQFPPLQAPEAYNLDGIIAEMKASKTASHLLVV